MRHFLSILLFLLASLTSKVLADHCSRVNLCCLNVSPWLGDTLSLCGYAPRDRDEVVGLDCIPSILGLCPPLYVRTCCDSLRREGSCALGVRCEPRSLPSSTTTTSSTRTSSSSSSSSSSTSSSSSSTSRSSSSSSSSSTSSSSTSTPTIPPSPLPSPWSTERSCAVDTPSRIFTSSTLTVLSDNTPANCIANCNARGFTHAGVEYGTECFCGGGYVAGSPPPEAEGCTIPCSGDASQTCGGDYRIQIYTRPPFPGGGGSGPVPGWETRFACAVDDVADRIIIGDQVVASLDDNTPANCIEYCDGLGYTHAGVEFSRECFCGNGVQEGVEVAPTSECNMACPGDGSLTCGGPDRIQVYRKL